MPSATDRWPRHSNENLARNQCDCHKQQPPLLAECAKANGSRACQATALQKKGRTLLGFFLGGEQRGERAVSRIRFLGHREGD